MDYWEINNISWSRYYNLGRKCRSVFLIVLRPAVRALLDSSLLFSLLFACSPTMIIQLTELSSRVGSNKFVTCMYICFDFNWRIVLKWVADGVMEWHKSLIHTDESLSFLRHLMSMEVAQLLPALDPIMAPHMVKFSLILGAVGWKYDCTFNKTNKMGWQHWWTF